MTFKLHSNIQFPKFMGAKCYMMPIIQGRAESLPDHLAQYADLIEQLVIEPGRLGYITIDESFVDAGKSQRGYGVDERTLHTEACLSNQTISWGPAPTWGSNSVVKLDPELRALIANSIDDTCMVWNDDVRETTFDGDLSARADQFPRSTGRFMKSGEVMNIGIWTPHECIKQRAAGNRQFVRIVGSGVYGTEPRFTINEKLAA